MKKIVLFLAVGLLFAVNANAEDNAANTVSAANEVKTQANAAATQEVVVLDETANDENWQYHKMQTLNALKDIDKKIEDAQKNKKPVAELEAQKNKLIEQLDGFDNKIMEEGKDEEMIKARAAKKPEGINFERQKFELLEKLKEFDEKIKAAGDDSSVKSGLEEQKNKLIEQLEDVEKQIIENDSTGELAKARAEAEKTKAEEAKAEDKK